MRADGSGIVAMPRVHSLALRLARVAHGELDAAVAGGNGHDWDLAAADLLVHEAGGMMTALDGKALIYNRPDPVHGMLIAAGRGAARGAGRSGARADQRTGVTTRRSRANVKELAMSATAPQKQLLHLVFGGELTKLDTTEFKDLDKLDIVGVYPNYASAYAAWKAKAQQTGRQRADALLHRSPAPLARSGGRGREARALTGSPMLAPGRLACDRRCHDAACERPARCSLQRRPRRG